MRNSLHLLRNNKEGVGMKTLEEYKKELTELQEAIKIAEQAKAKKWGSQKRVVNPIVLQNWKIESNRLEAIVGAMGKKQ